MARRIQLRRGTAANWTSSNPTLAQGEVGLETDTDKFKIGDGSTVWNSLDYNYNDKLTTRGDLLYRDSNNETTRLPIGTNGQVIKSDGTDVSWEDEQSSFADPMTTRGDIIYKDSSNVTTRLPLGTNGQVIKSDGTDLSWDDESPGFQDPMTSVGDIIYKNSSNVTTRLPIGADRTVLKSDGTDLSYVSDKDINIEMDAILFTNSVLWEHPRGDDELIGNSAYGNGAYKLGIYEQINLDGATSVDIYKVKWCVYDTNPAAIVTIRFYVRSSPASFDWGATTPDATYVCEAGELPSTRVATEFVIPGGITIEDGQYLIIIASSDITASTNLYIARFSEQSAEEPYRHGFILTTVTDAYSGGSVPSYCGGTMQLSGITDISTEQVYTYQHPRSPEELTGNAQFGYYGSTHPVIGMRQICDSDFSFSKIRCGFWNSGGDEIHLAVYVRNSTAAFDLSVVEADAEIIYQAGEFPSTAGLTTFDFGTTISVTSGQCVFVLVLNQGTGLSRGYSWTTQSEEEPYRLTWILGTSLTTTFSLASPNTTYQTAGIDFLDEQNAPIPIETAFNNLPAASVQFNGYAIGMTSLNVEDAIEEIYTSSSGIAENVTYDNTTSGLTGTNVQDAIDEVAAISDVNRIVLPDEITAVVGDNLQVFVRGVIEAQDPYYQPYQMLCSKGKAYPRYFEYTPLTTDVTGSPYTFTTRLLNNDISTKTSTECDIVVVEASGEPDNNVNVLCVGDSLTGGGGWPTECARRLTGTAGTPAGLEYGNITFIGSVGTPPVEWCGYGGWTWSAFIGTGRVSYWVTSVGHDKTMAADQHSVWLDSSTTNTWQLEAVDGDLIKFNPLDGQTDMPPATDTLTWVSGGTNHADIIYSVETEEPGTPFWDPIENEFSFAAFMNAYGFSGDIDVCYVLLGWNEVGVPTKSEVGDHASSIANARTFIDKLHSDYPSCEVRVMGIQMPSMNGGLAANYGAGDSLANYYKTVRCANSLNIEYQNLCNEAAYSGFCRYIGIAAQFDSEWNMSYTTHVVNDRSAVTENRGTNGVHPASGGYYQIGDAVFRDFIRSFCSD